MMKYDQSAMDTLVKALRARPHTKGELVELLGCHESTVWRRLQHLEEQGYDIVRRGFESGQERTYAIAGVR